MVFMWQKFIQSGVKYLCSNEQLADQIVITLYVLNLLFCFRVCCSEVTTLE